MIKNIKLFPNNNDMAMQSARLIRDKLMENGYVITDKDYDLAIAVGGDGSFLRMVKENNFNSDICYVGINAGTLGFMQEVKLEDIDKFIDELNKEEYKIEEVGIQETVINYDYNNKVKFYSLNEIVVREKNLKLAKFDVNIDKYFLEKFTGDGLLVATSYGSTAYNLSLGGSIVYGGIASLQITPIAPINSKVYRSLSNSVIIPDKKEIEIIPENNKDLMIIADGENRIYPNVSSVKTKLNGKKIKRLRLSYYNFPQKINEKLLTD